MEADMILSILYMVYDYMMLYELLWTFFFLSKWLTLGFVVIVTYSRLDGKICLKCFVN